MKKVKIVLPLLLLCIALVAVLLVTSGGNNEASGTSQGSESHVHDYIEEVVEPTCSEGGYTRYTCEGCGDSYVNDYTNPVAHSYEPVVTEPTCVDGGYTTFTCSVCGDSHVKDFTDMVDHSWGDWETVQEPTTEMEGLQRRTCSYCGETEEETLDALPAEHSHDYVEETIEPTCTEQGYSVYTCSCGESYTGSFVDALGHTYRTTEEAATCTKQGKITKTCDRCGHTETEMTEALGHAYQTTTKAPTCTVAGTKTQVCSRCSHTVTETIAATGHAWSDWTTTVEPTTETKGEKQRTCSHCGEVETEEINVLEDGGEENYIDPRITVSKSKYYTDYEYMKIRVSVVSEWAGEQPSIWVNEDGSLTVVYYNLDGERIEAIVAVPPDGYCRMWTLCEDGTFVDTVIGAHS